MAWLKKATVVFALAAIAVLLFVPCMSPVSASGLWGLPGEASADTSGSSAMGDWTVLLYLCGTDLETEGGAATDNLTELLNVDLPDGVRFAIQTGGTRSWMNDVVNSDVLQRWIVADNELVLLEELPLSSMGKAETLGGFLAWGTENFPAERNMVILWNHGGGSAVGISFDELYDYDGLSLAELNDGLEMANANFEIVGFDACLMATMETAAAVAPYGNYMVASEEYEPGGGWDYEALLSHLAENPDSDGLETGKAICDSYYRKCKTDGNEAMATLSVMDLSKTDALVDAFDHMAAEMTGATEEIASFQTFVQGAVRAENYGGNNDNEGYTNMVDLGDLVINTQNVLSETADRVLDALFDAVVYEVHGEQRASANGLSVFFPLGYDDDILNTYAPCSPSDEYVRFLEAATGWNAPSTYEVSASDSVFSRREDYGVSYVTYINDEDYFVLEFEQGIEAVSSVQFALFYMDYDYEEYMLLGFDNDIDAYWDEGVFIDNFRSVWMGLDGQYCAPVLIAENDQYNVYSVPILLNGEKTNLRCAFVWDEGEDGHYEVHGAWNGIDGATGMSARDIRKLRDGDEITLLFESENWETGESITYETGSFTVDGGVEFHEIELFDGDYLYMYYITDVFGNEYFSDSVFMEVKDGEINVYPAEENE